MLAIVAVVASSCTKTNRVVSSTVISRQPPATSASRTASVAPSVSPSGSPSPGVSTQDAIKASCTKTPKASKSGTTAEVPSAGIREIEGWVEQARGLQFKHPVDIVNVTKQGLVQRIASSLGGAQAKRQMAAQGKVLQAIGAIPSGTSLVAANKKALTGGVAAYYDPATHRLVSPGVTRLSPEDKFTLSHELTHALDDQTFDLAKTNMSDFGCSSDRTNAAHAVIEGNATWVSFQVVRDHFSATDISSMIKTESQGAAAASKGVPKFLIDVITWPYLAGQSFIAARRDQGGSKAVNQVLENYPASTEQILHPQKYPGDKPIAVEVPDYSLALGDGWKPLYASDIGEADVAILLSQQLDTSVANDAAAGWGGATIRAWGKGKDTAVVLGTQWDTGQDAVEFATAMQDYISKTGSRGQVIATPPTGVTVVFGSSDEITQTLAAHVPA